MKKFGKCWESKPGEKQVCYLCAMHMQPLICEIVCQGSKENNHAEPTSFTSIAEFHPNRTMKVPGQVTVLFYNARIASILVAPLLTITKITL